MLNNITIHGRLTADSELKQTQSGVAMCNFTVAVDRSHSKGEEKITDFFNCTAWRGLGEMISKHFTKGKEILLSGEMHGDKYVDNDGNNRVAWKVQVNTVDFCGSKAESVHSNSPNPNVVSGTSEAEDDLPF